MWNSAMCPISRVDRVCEWCGEMILIGQRHVSYFGDWEGEYQNWRMHTECYACASDNFALTEGFTPHEGERPKQ